MRFKAAEISESLLLDRLLTQVLKLSEEKVEPSELATDELSTKPRFRLRQMLAFVAFVCVIAALLRTPFLQTRNNLGHTDWLRGSPFTRVDLKDGTAQVEFEGKPYELVSINGKTTEQILDSSRRRFGSSLGEKRFIEDLPAVLGGLGLNPDETAVDLVLIDSDGKTVEIKDAPMTEANRALVYRTSRRPRTVEPYGIGNRLILVCIFVALFGKLPSRVFGAIAAFRSKQTQQSRPEV